MPEDESVCPQLIGPSVIESAGGRKPVRDDKAISRSIVNRRMTIPAVRTGLVGAKLLPRVLSDIVCPNVAEKPRGLAPK